MIGRSARNVICAAVLLAACGGSAAASGPEQLEADRLAEKGARHYKLGEYREAIEAYKAAYARVPAAALLYNIAQSYRLLGPPFCADAFRFYKNYLAEGPDPALRPLVERRIAEMEACVKSQQAEKAKPLAPEGSEQQTPAVAPALPNPPARLHALAWIAFGTAAGGAILAIVAGAQALDQQGELDQICGNGPCPSSARGEIDDYNLRRTLGTIGLGVAAAGAVAGFFLWRYAGARSAEGSTRRALLEPWLSVGMAGVRGRF